MKNVKFSSARAVVVCGVLAIAGMTGAFAQSSVTTTTTSAGTVSEFTPGTITVSSSSGAPVSYSYSKTTTYVDENGNPVSVQTIRSGVPVTVYYTQDGGQMVASKVVVRHDLVPSDGSTVIKKTTTTTTSPAP